MKDIRAQEYTFAKVSSLIDMSAHVPQHMSGTDVAFPAPGPRVCCMHPVCYMCTVCCICAENTCVKNACAENTHVVENKTANTWVENIFKAMCSTCIKTQVQTRV